MQNGHVPKVQGIASGLSQFPKEGYTWSYFFLVNNIFLLLEEFTAQNEVAEQLSVYNKSMVCCELVDYCSQLNY